ncbi:unnamed protein product [Blepharisma stoltei]|uniref:RING-type domain-containing protein n=1 Tax=Blepharisma stoltei TaxID=1481888 RepID=A0AAU9IGT2_9CILI|nr:unnamed protein product [Blepharisma stoltei]
MNSSYSSSDKEYIRDPNTNECKEKEESSDSNVESDDESDSYDSSNESKSEESQESIEEHDAEQAEEPLSYVEAKIKNIPFGLLYKTSLKNLGELIHLDKPSLILIKNESSGFNFKLNKNKEKIEDLLSAIETLNEQIGAMKLGKDENIKNLIQKLKNSKNIEISERISKLLSFYYCEDCKKPKEEIQLSCGHIFCSKCLKASIRKETKGFLLLTDEEKLSGEPKCPSCNSSFSLDDYKNVLKEKFEQANNFLEIREAEQEKNKVHFEKQQKNHKNMNIEAKQKRKDDPSCVIRCKRCLKTKEVGQFFNDPCECTCKECFSLLAWGGMTSCYSCGKAYNSNICYLEDTCDGCKRNVYIVGEQLKSICKSHKHCNDCLNEAYESKKCKKCKKILNASTLAEIKDSLYFRCFSCKDLLLRAEIYRKGCCVNHTCNKCQNRNAACLACREVIAPA